MTEIAPSKASARTYDILTEVARLTSASVMLPSSHKVMLLSNSARTCKWSALWAQRLQEEPACQERAGKASDMMTLFDKTAKKRWRLTDRLRIGDSGCYLWICIPILKSLAGPQPSCTTELSPDRQCRRSRTRSSTSKKKTRPP